MNDEDFVVYLQQDQSACVWRANHGKYNSLL